MAKGDGESYDFVPPDFNEDEFIHREMVEFKTTVIRTVLAIVAVLVSWALFLYFDGDDSKVWPAGLGVCLAFGLMLKPVFRRFTDVSIYKRMDWFGTGFMFFLTWLALFIVAINPPVSDVSPPQVMVSADPPVQGPGSPVTVSFLAADNTRLREVPTLRLERDGVPVDLPDPSFSPQTSDAGHYAATFSNPTTVPGNYTVLVSATDKRGLVTEGRAEFRVKPEELRVSLPRGGNLTGIEAIVVEVDARPCTLAAPPCLRTVYFRPTSGGESVPFEYNDRLGGWESTARFAGWRDGENTGRIVAEFLDHYQRSVRIDGGLLESSETYTFRVQPPLDRHTVQVPIDPTGPPPAFASAYGLLGTAAALLGAAAVVRTRRES